MRGDGRDLDERAQGLLVLGPDPLRELIEVGTAKGNHPRIMPGEPRARAAMPSRRGLP
jgi:hypothetical protein